MPDQAELKQNKSIPTWNPDDDDQNSCGVILLMLVVLITAVLIARLLIKGN